MKSESEDYLFEQVTYSVVVIVGQQTRRPNSESNGKSVADFFKEHNKYVFTDIYFFGGL